MDEILVDLRVVVGDSHGVRAGAVIAVERNEAAVGVGHALDVNQIGQEPTRLLALGKLVEFVHKFAKGNGMFCTLPVI